MYLMEKFDSKVLIDGRTCLSEFLQSYSVVECTKIHHMINGLYNNLLTA